MRYKIDRNLFLENGPTLLAERDRRLRVASEIYTQQEAGKARLAATPRAPIKAAA